ncbi:flagellar basal body rod protein FlgB [Pandoraea apista]|uniref:Flagellar basal body rod protein FlgB n=1 Tax=Pandoraea apista TaxID=93218 RepID=A0ABX9ZT64_9BURK|nr:flagellar basal-body rod protein FlgB [Pandoraea apista]AVF39746.1 flagellar basal body rod protein FlgB [Pandoraea apista]OXS94144.1 flagellar basal-body rod protein FlgB [Pandoraea apista]PTE01131.1 flagellar basal body rod protein FlgB [Pandoraea apista]RRJ33987.1 flagellar basal body rod protein FlgB [Pandoraea apista]
MGAVDISHPWRRSLQTFFSQALGVHAAALRAREDRTRVLAANLANEATPGYQARDLDFGERVQQHLNAGMTPLGGVDTLHASESFDALRYRVPTQARADGNTVELGIEQALFAQNLSDWQASLTFLNRRLAGLQKVIDGGR